MDKIKEIIEKAKPCWEKFCKIVAKLADAWDKLSKGGKIFVGIVAFVLICLIIPTDSSKEKADEPNKALPTTSEYTDTIEATEATTEAVTSLTTQTTTQTTVAETTSTTTTTTEPATEPPVEYASFIINLNSGVIHASESCGGVKKMKESNKYYTDLQVSGDVHYNYNACDKCCWYYSKIFD